LQILCNSPLRGYPTIDVTLPGIQHPKTFQNSMTDAKIIVNKICGLLEESSPM